MTRSAKTRARTWMTDSARMTRRATRSPDDEGEGCDIGRWEPARLPEREERGGGHFWGRRAGRGLGVRRGGGLRGGGAEGRMRPVPPRRPAQFPSHRRMGRSLSRRNARPLPISREESRRRRRRRRSGSTSWAGSGLTLSLSLSESRQSILYIGAAARHPPSRAGGPSKSRGPALP